MSSFTEAGRHYTIRFLLDSLYEVVRAFEYYSDLLPPEDNIIHVPEGEVTDGASIPWFLRWLIPIWGVHGAAAIIHDLLYRKKKYHRKLCDQIFLEAMLVLKVNKLKASFMYFGVRLFGWWYYHEYDIGVKEWCSSVKKNLIRLLRS